MKSWTAPNHLGSGAGRIHVGPETKGVFGQQSLPRFRCWTQGKYRRALWEVSLSPAPGRLGLAHSLCVTRGQIAAGCSARFIGSSSGVGWNDGKETKNSGWTMRIHSPKNNVVMKQFVDGCGWFPAIKSSVQLRQEARSSLLYFLVVPLYLHIPPL